MLPFVSIIIPAFNEEKILPLCLQSINELDYPKNRFEVLVIDNGSTDHTGEIARFYSARLIVNDRERVSGLRNIGALASNGQILAFVDADCIVSNEWLEEGVKYYNDINIAAWGAPPILPKGSTWVQRTWFIVRQKQKDMQEVDWLESMNLFVRREDFIRIGGFNQDLVTCEDVDFCYRIKKGRKIISDNKISVTHLGEAKDLRDFIKKELWRGQSNLVGVRSHKLTLKELPSLAIPVYFGILIPFLFIVFAFSLNPIWLAILIVTYLLPLFVVLIKVRKKRVSLSILIGLLVLLQIYFIVRTVAVLKKN